MKLSDFLISEIYKLTNTDKIFGYIGGMVAHIADSIYLNKDVELVNTINEQGAGFAADGYARISNKTGVAIATSGPGATNLLTPLSDCFFDSVPVLFITGQVNTYEYKKYDIKQCGFQETNIVDMAKPVTKYAKMITDAKSIKYELQKAISIANSGRKGPVLLDIPMDIQRQDINPDELEEYTENTAKTEINFDFKSLEKFKKPLILAGNGINLSNAKNELSAFLKKNQIPVVQSLLGVDTIFEDYSYNMGLIGTYGNRFGNLAFYACDLLLVLGSRLDIRQTGGNIEFMKNKTIIHVDIDEKELECPKFHKTKVKSDLKSFLTELNKQNLKFDISNWQKTCLKLKDKFPAEKKVNKTPNIILSEIFKNLDKNAAISADVGQNQVWAAQSYIPQNSSRYITSGGFGSMGFALPSAIGTFFAGKMPVVISGDGGLQMNIQELEIIKRRNIPAKIIVLNNKSLAMVRTFQELYFENRLVSTVWDYSAPDFEKIANAYGIKSKTINADKFNINEIKNDLISNEPFVFNIIFDEKTYVEPRLQFGNSIENQHPLIDKEEIEQFLN